MIIEIKFRFFQIFLAILFFLISFPVFSQNVDNSIMENNRRIDADIEEYLQSIGLNPITTFLPPLAQ